MDFDSLIVRIASRAKAVLHIPAPITVDIILEPALDINNPAAVAKALAHALEWKRDDRKGANVTLSQRLGSQDRQEGQERLRCDR